MRQLVLTLLVALFAGVPVLAAAAPAPAAPLQDEETPIVDKRPEVKELLETFKAHTKKRGKEDEEAIAVLDKLYQEFPESGPKDRAAIVKAVEKSFKEKRNDELSPGVPDDRLYMAAATVLKDMGPESVKPLMGLIGKAHKKNLRLQARLILSLGNTRHLDAVKTLTDLLKNKDAEVQAAGAQALGLYDEAPLKARKTMFEELLKTLMGVKGQMDSDPQNIEARERYYAIAAPIVASLGSLSGHDEREPEAWQRWWNKNKKADWDEEQA